MTLRNYRFRRFLLDPEMFKEYWRQLQYLRAKDTVKIGRKTYKAKDIMKMKFGDVMDIKDNFRRGNYPYLFEKIFGINETMLMAMRVLSFFPAYNYLEATLYALIEAENNLFTYEDPDYKSAGIHRMGVFGDANTLISFGERFGQAPHDIEEWPYFMVFTVMAHSAQRLEIEMEYQRITAHKP